jgi:chromosome segregation ATPase
MTDIPVWTIILALFGALVNLILLMVGAALRAQISAMRAEAATQTATLVGELTGAVSQIRELKDSIKSLTLADTKMNDTIGKVEKDLSEYKLHVAEKYARSDRVEELINNLFKRFDGLQDLIRKEVDRVALDLHKRIDFLHPPGHNKEQ